MFCLAGDDRLDGDVDQPKETGDQANAEKQLMGIENKLSNEGFLAKAPEAVINGAKEDAAKLRALIEKLTESERAMRK